MKRRMNELIRELGEASRRPLFVELALQQRSNKAMLSSKLTTAENRQPAVCSDDGDVPLDTMSERSLSRTKSPARGDCGMQQIDRTWIELLGEATAALPFMTDEDHSEILRLSSILLLGFLLPYSTGNEFYLLQNAQRTNPFKPSDYVLSISLEERLEKSVKNLNANPLGEDYTTTLTDPSVDKGLHAFVEALGALLAGRPAHREQVDIIHILAMAIYPSCSSVVSGTGLRIFQDTPSWHRAQLLMRHPVAHQFYIHYGHRRTFVKLVLDHLSLPELQDEYSGSVIGPLLFGSLQHLRMALRDFAASAKNPRDSHLGLSAAMLISVQIRNLRLFLKPDWDFLLHHMVDDRTDYNCRDICHRENNTVDDAFFCPHAARGKLLAEFIMRACRCRIDANKSFLSHVASSLTDAIEWQLDCWIQNEQEETETVDKQHAPCLLASLLFAARHLFHLQAPPVESPDDDDPFKTLIRSSLQLLRHSDQGVVVDSIGLLVTAFSNVKNNNMDGSAALLFSAMKACHEEGRLDRHFERLIAVASSSSSALASMIYDFITTQITTEGKSYSEKGVFFRFLSVLSLNFPLSAAKGIRDLMRLVDDPMLPQENRLQVASTIMSTRLARFFLEKDGKQQLVLRNFLLSSSVDNWSKYLLARHAIVTGNFALASDMYLSLQNGVPLNECHYLWIAVLQRVAAAEASLSHNGAMGIPEATKKLNSAVSLLQSFSAFSPHFRKQWSFQLRFLLLRLDFLDLLAVLRHLTREMRLTGRRPSKHTRSFLHLRNAVRGLERLSFQYWELGRCYGVIFRDRQTSAALAVLQCLSLFMALSAKTVFADASSPKGSGAEISICAFVPDYSHPLLSLIRRLDEVVIKPMDISLDPLVRAAAMLELIDGVLMTPSCFPRDFFSPHMCANPELLITQEQSDAKIEQLPRVSSGVLRAVPSQMISFRISGVIPLRKLECRSVPTWTVLSRHRLRYVRPLVSNDENIKDGDAAEETAAGKGTRLPDTYGVEPISSSISSSGRFYFSVELPPLLDEGTYTLEVKLGCRDARGQEWELPTTDSKKTTTIRVSRYN